MTALLISSSIAGLTVARVSIIVIADFCDKSVTEALEFVDALDYSGQLYQAFFPAETEGEEEDPDAGLVILKVLHEDGEDILSTPDSDEELEAVYDLFMEALFDGEE